MAVHGGSGRDLLTSIAGKLLVLDDKTVVLPGHGNATTIGKVIGPSFSAEVVPAVIEAMVNVYVEQRSPGERFIDTYHRLGLEPFKARAYAGRDKRKSTNTQGEAAHV